jgi:hypothetical protein
MTPQDILDLITQAKGLLGRSLSLTDVDGRDTVDQELTAIMASLAEAESSLGAQAMQIGTKQREAGESVSSAEMTLKASPVYELYTHTKLMREAIVERLRGLRTHSRREYQERSLS